MTPPEDLDFGLDRYGLADLVTRSGAKWHRAPEGGIAAWVADMDFPVAPAIRTALERALRSDDLGYPSLAMTAAVREAFAERLATRFGVSCRASDVLLASDVVQCLFAAVESFSERGDGVLFLTPAYPPFFATAVDTGRRVLTSDLVATSTGYRIDADALGELVRRERPRLMLLCNPHNPTGRVLDRDELSLIAELACANDLVVLSDEIHADLVLAGATHTAFATLGPDVAARTVTLTSASKAFNIAGLHCAAAVFGSTTLRRRFEQVPARLLGGPGSLGLASVLAAYSGADDWLAAVLRQLDANRAEVARVAAALPGVVHHPPEATYLAWLNLSNCGLDGDPATVLEEATGVVLSRGPDFGSAGVGHVRLNFATTPAVLGELLARLTRALSR